MSIVTCPWKREMDEPFISSKNEQNLMISAYLGSEIMEIFVKKSKIKLKNLLNP